jgi:hypothetical protein
MARAGGATRKSARSVPLILCVVLVVLGVGAAVIAKTSTSSTPTSSLSAAATRPPAAAKVSATHPSTSTSSTSSASTHASTTIPATTTTVPPPTTTTLPAAAAGFVPGRVTAVGDSVMLDYQDPLQTDIPGASVDASVSRQWSEGESILQGLKSSGQLGAEVIVALSTNGPISNTDFDNMMAILSGASRVVFVNVHVDRPWQDPNNAVLTAGAGRYPNVVVADWATLAAQNPSWFGSDGTHLAIDGPGADALASLITSTLNNG